VDGKGNSQGKKKLKRRGTWKSKRKAGRRGTTTKHKNSGGQIDNESHKRKERWEKSDTEGGKFYFRRRVRGQKAHRWEKFFSGGTLTKGK